MVPQTGAIQVMYGGDNFDKRKFNLATQSERTAGSAFKAFTLAAAFEEGLQPTQVYNATQPVVIPEDQCAGEKGYGPWTPENADPSEGGFMNMTTATAHSVNVYFAQLIADIRPEPVVDAATRMGVVSYARDAVVNVPPVCSITLGAVQVNPLSMTAGYATLANDGVHCLPFAIRRVESSTGEFLLRARPVCEQTIDKKVARQVNALLKGVLEFGTASGQGIGRPAAGKTGTGQEYQDAWFLGYVPQLVTGVWVGYTKALIPMKNLPVLGGANAFGGSIAAPIWHDVMVEAVSGLPVEDFPAPPPPKLSRVPDVVGLTEDEARQVLLEAGFTTLVEKVNSNQPKGTVADQSPKGGSSAPGGSSITIFVSTGEQGKVRVPGVIGYTEEQATQILFDQGLAVSVYYQVVQDKSYDGRVLGQNPEAGARVEPGSTVTIVVGQKA
jgi:membrane peptidoglycan carboxypeptidase